MCCVQRVGLAQNGQNLFYFEVSVLNLHWMMMIPCNKKSNRYLPQTCESPAVYMNGSCLFCLVKDSYNEHFVQFHIFLQ